MSSWSGILNTPQPAKGKEDVALILLGRIPDGCQRLFLARVRWMRTDGQVGHLLRDENSTGILSARLDLSASDSIQQTKVVTTPSSRIPSYL